MKREIVAEIVEALEGKKKTPWWAFWRDKY
jgi:hypothetical protein